MRRMILIAMLLLVPMLGHAQRGADRQTQVEQLRDALQRAPSEEVAVAIEGRLRRMELEAGTPAVTLLMSRGLRDLAAKSYDDAIEVFSDAIILDPSLAEAYHQRAIAKFRAGDSVGAVKDLEETLRREPRSFAAWRTLVEIAVARENWKSAYEACVKLLEMNPKMPGGEERLKDLKRRAFGQEL
ncbi:MAG: tetratricopeptide repeat protein [Acetobacteraceae bacterium]